MDKDKELEKLKKILESCHINFLIGSGASMDYLQTLNEIENLLSAIQLKRNSEPENEEFKIVEASIKYNYFIKSIRGNLGFFEPKIALERKDEFKQTKMNYHQFVLSLNTILLRRKSTIINKQINLFTTNMDLFLDCSLEANNLEFNDGFYGRLKPFYSTSNYKKSIYQNSPQYDNRSELPTFNLFKLHGSVNWTKGLRDTESVINYDPYLSAVQRLNGLDLNEQSLIEIIAENSIEKLIEKAKKKKWNKSIDKFLEAYEQLIMVNPTKEKFELTTIDYNFYEQLRIYSNVLEKENSVLFVTGFSFADEHIREITQRVAKSNPTLMVYIFCYSENDKKNIETWFSEGKFGNIISRSFDDLSFDFKKLLDVVLHPIANDFDSEYFGNKKGSLETDIEEKHTTDKTKI